MTITSTMPPQQIASIIARYCDGRELAPSRFGRNAVNDPRLMFDLRDGRQPRPRTIDRINAALSEGAQS